ncbi:MAG: HDOD domain-containing protein [Phycisphaeraceae bacterium]|nr:HDOD domain-containing protein [Phycisphaeraceae bacterium]
MTTRAQLNVHDLPTLHERLDRMLASCGVETQPKIALRLLELAGDDNAQIKDYVEVIRNDWAMTGRILRLANSAFYAQRTEVTRLERALVILGLERTKAVTLGFYISRSLLGSASRELGRRVWTQSVYRAALAQALAKEHCPALSSEAYIVGLMLDCGVALMPRLIGDMAEKYVELFDSVPTPAKLFSTEFETLPFTHVDVGEALMRRWRMPALLARPVMWHHTPPSVGRTQDPATLLHRVAFYAGAVQLGERPHVEGHQSSPAPSTVGRLFELGPGGLDRVVKAAAKEFAATIGLYCEPEETPGSLDNAADAVQLQLVEMMDEQMTRTTRVEERGGPERLIIDGLHFDLEPGRPGEVVTYISSPGGERLMSFVVRPRNESAHTIRRLLGLEETPDEEVESLVKTMRSLAA